jgi:hypothetical protein
MADKFDPRFNPAFQRGYQGKAELKAQPQRPEQSATPGSSVPAPAVAPQQHRVDPAAAERLFGHEPRFEDAAEAGERNKFNPFLLGLLVIAAALIVVGLFVFQSTREIFLDSEVDFMTVQAVIYAVPIAISLGIATVIGVLFVYAVRWNRSH